MTRREDDVRAEMIALLPDGWVWPKRVAETLLAALLEPIAGELAQIEQTAAAMIDELDPRSAALCLTDYERVLGPDPCGRDTSTMSLGDRRTLAHQRWTGRGGASRAYFIGLAAKRGIAITISENRVSNSSGRFISPSPRRACSRPAKARPAIGSTT
jgi:uncharacterized protein YmfQ (DUF2313 family)